MLENTISWGRCVYRMQFIFPRNEVKLVVSCREWNEPNSRFDGFYLKRIIFDRICSSILIAFHEICCSSGIDFDFINKSELLRAASRVAIVVHRQRVDR